MSEPVHISEILPDTMQKIDEQMQRSQNTSRADAAYDTAATTAVAGDNAETHGPSVLKPTARAAVVDSYPQQKYSLHSNEARSLFD